MSEATPFGIYLHIPYCKAKCRYCDFYSAPGARGVPQSYVDALLRELAKNTRRPDTLYFGGGTPALLVPAQAAALIEAANPLPGAEITLEANPDVVTPETLRGFRAAGVTRISYGVQSADDAQLRRLGRTHTAAGAAQALTWAREAGFPEICGDIMLALPEYTNAEFDRTLALLRDGGCTHISALLIKGRAGHGVLPQSARGCPTATRRQIFTCMPCSSSRPQATGSMRSATLPAPATKVGTSAVLELPGLLGCRSRCPQLSGRGAAFLAGRCSQFYRWFPLWRKKERRLRCRRFPSDAAAVEPWAGSGRIRPMGWPFLPNRSWTFCVTALLPAMPCLMKSDCS